MVETIKVQRANVVLDVRPDQKEYYMEKGFSVIDDKGKVIEEAISDDVGALKNQIKNLKEQIAKKDAEIEQLKSAKTKKSESK